jgi:hypothetical protein
MNPPYTFNGPRGGEARHIWQWLTRDSIQGMVKKILKNMGNSKTKYNNQSIARTIYPSKGSSGSQRVQIIQGGQDVAIGLQGCCYRQTWQNRGFLSY